MTSTPAETTARSEAADGGCEMCPHALSAHDAISLRFCAATLAAALTRGCVCPSS
jgi:hypothetical protein